MSNLSIVGRNAECQALSDLLDAGHVEIRTGTQPASVENAATGTLIATLTLNTPSFATPSGGAMDLDPPNTATAGADGTITYARFYTSANAAVLDASITESGGGGEIIATTVSVLTNMTIAITFTYTIPE